MRDPFEELTRLEGSSRPPLPPAEVRRRGDRLRRRRTALQAVAGAAAVALVVSGGALATGELTGTGPAIDPAESGTPVPSPTAEAAELTWITSVPDGFPLDWSLPEPGGDVPEPQWDEGPRTALSAVACGENDALPDRPTDGLRVQVSPPDQSVWRHLLLFRDDAAATEAYAALRSTAGRCSEGPQGMTDDRLSPEEVRWSIQQPPEAQTPVIDVEGAFYARGTDVRAPGRILTRVVQVGNALLVARRDSASSATGTDPEARAFTGDVEALAELMCVFSAAGCGNDRDDAAADDLEPEPLPHILSAEDLDRHTGEAGWTSTQGLLEQPMVCAEESTDALARGRTDTRMYARFDDDGATVAMATTTVLDLEPGTGSAAGYERAADWLTTCDRPLDGTHHIFSVGQAYGPVHDGSFPTGPWTWRTVMSTAPEVCQECDAAWNHHQGVTLAGDRLVIAQVSTRGDLQQSVDDRDSPLPGLLEAAALLASATGDRGNADRSAESHGPLGMWGVHLGMSPAEAAAQRGLRVLGRSGPACRAFVLDGPGRPPNNVDGFLDRRLGVAALFARPGMATPEGVMLGVPEEDVRRAYPAGRAEGLRYVADVPGHPDRSYTFGFDRGRVHEILLALDDRRCV